MTKQSHWDSWPTQFIKIKIYIQILINRTLIPSRRIRKISLTPSSNKFLPSAALRPTPVSNKITSGSLKMIFWAQSMGFRFLNKSKRPKYHLRKSRKSRKESQDSTQNPPKSPKSVNPSKSYKKGSKFSANSEAKPKTFPKTMERRSLALS